MSAGFNRWGFVLLILLVGLLAFFAVDLQEQFTDQLASPPAKKGQVERFVFFLGFHQRLQIRARGQEGRGDFRLSSTCLEHCLQQLDKPDRFRLRFPVTGHMGPCGWRQCEGC